MPDTLLALVPRARLSSMLTAFHRNGYGHVTRVLDPERAPLAQQLGRAGVRASRIAEAEPIDSVLLFVHAPKRTTEAAALAVANGATDAEVVTCSEPVSAAVAPGLISFAGNRRGRRAERRAPQPSDTPTPELAADE
jgi:hypothetical protein